MQRSYLSGFYYIDQLPHKECKKTHTSENNFIFLPAGGVETFATLIGAPELVRQFLTPKVPLLIPELVLSPTKKLSLRREENSLILDAFVQNNIQGHPPVYGYIILPTKFL